MCLCILFHLLTVTTLLVVYYCQLQFEVKQLRLREIKYPTQVDTASQCGNFLFSRAFVVYHLTASLYTRWSDDHSEDCNQ